VQQVAGKMFSRWGQENFFKYLAENFDFDRMIQYGTEPLSNDEAAIPNPEYKELTYKIKKMREKCARLHAQLYGKLETAGLENAHLHQIISQNVQITEQITDYRDNINDLLSKRKSIPARIKVKNLPEDRRYNKLIEESKKLKNLILMLSYRAETALYNLLPDFYSNAKKDGRQILKEVFTSCADLIPDYQRQILYVRLHSLATPRANDLVKNLCILLNDTNTTFPMTDLKIVYETVAL
jgi:RNAse (barnase) inhibitor barstar